MPLKQEEWFAVYDANVNYRHPEFKGNYIRVTGYGNNSNKVEYYTIVGALSYVKLVKLLEGTMTRRRNKLGIEWMTEELKENDSDVEFGKYGYYAINHQDSPGQNLVPVGRRYNVSRFWTAKFKI